MSTVTLAAFSTGGGQLLHRHPCYSLLFLPRYSLSFREWTMFYRMISSKHFPVRKFPFETCGMAISSIGTRDFNSSKAQLRPAVRCGRTAPSRCYPPTTAGGGSGGDRLSAEQLGASPHKGRIKSNWINWDAGISHLQISRYDTDIWSTRSDGLRPPIRYTVRFQSGFSPVSAPFSDLIVTSFPSKARPVS